MFVGVEFKQLLTRQEEFHDPANKLLFKLQVSLNLGHGCIIKQINGGLEQTQQITFHCVSKTLYTLNIVDFQCEKMCIWTHKK